MTTTDARRLGGLHRRRATSVATVYDFAGLRTVEGAQRLLETAALETFALDNSIARNRALIAAARSGRPRSMAACHRGLRFKGAASDAAVPHAR